MFGKFGVLAIIVHSHSWLLSNMIRVACYGTKYGSLFISSFFIIMKCTNTIPVVHAELYLLLEMYWWTGPVTCVQLSICPPWLKTIYEPVLLKVSGHFWQLESENTINWISDLMPAFLKRVYRGSFSILAYYFNPKFLISLIYLKKCNKP